MKDTPKAAHFRVTDGSEEVNDKDAICLKWAAAEIMDEMKLDFARLSESDFTFISDVLNAINAKLDGRKISLNNA
jgi:hypothetical protein